MSQLPDSDMIPFSDRYLAVWRGLLRVHAHVVGLQNADLEDRLGLSVTEWEVLHALATAPGGQRRVRDIAGTVLLTTGGVTRLVSRLEQRGLLTRTPCADDRRGTALALTPAGEETYRRASPGRIVQDLVLDRLTEEQQQHLVDAWEAVLPGAAVLDDPAWSRRRHAR